MVSGVSTFCLVVSAVICLFGPAILAVIVIRKYQANWRALLLGAAVFIIAQPLLRIPILGQLGLTPWFILFTKAHPILYFSLLGLSAGIFEELGRFFGLKLFLKHRLTWQNGIVFGLGHGGAEAFLLVGLNYAYAVFTVVTGHALPSLATTPSYLFLVGGIERVLAVTAHIGMTLLVLYAVKTKKLRYLAYAILFHTLIDSPLLILKQVGINLGVWGSEGYVALFALMALWLIVRFKRILGNGEPA